MAVETFVPKRFSSAHRVIIDQADAICADYARQGLTMTLRQVYYQFVARGLIPNKPDRVQAARRHPERRQDGRPARLVLHGGPGPQRPRWLRRLPRPWALPGHRRQRLHRGPVGRPGLPPGGLGREGGPDQHCRAGARPVPGPHLRLQGLRVPVGDVRRSSPDARPVPRRRDPHRDPPGRPRPQRRRHDPRYPRPAEPDGWPARRGPAHRADHGADRRAAAAPQPGQAHRQPQHRLHRAVGRRVLGARRAGPRLPAGPDHHHAGRLRGRRGIRGGRAARAGERGPASG